MRQRAGVVINQHGRVLLIKRVREGRTYYVFPGGGVELGETLEQAAVREALEELGLHVALGRLAAVVTYGTNLQYYYAATVTGGELGTGTGPEFTQYPPERGTYEPVWVDLSHLHGLDVRPRPLAEAVAAPDWAGRQETLRLTDV